MAGIIATVLVAGAELGSRALLSGSARARGFPDEQIELKTTQLEELRHQGTRIDVLFVGSSPVHFGINTVEFEEAASGHRRVRAYNAAVNGPDFQGIRAIVEKYYLPHCDPKAIFIGLTPNDLNVGSQVVARATQDLIGLANHDIAPALYRVRLFDQRRRFARFLTTCGSRPLRRDETLRFHLGYEDFADREAVRAEWAAAGRLGNLRVDGPALDALAAFIQDQQSAGHICFLVNMPMRNDFRRYISDQEYGDYFSALETLAERGGASLLDLMDAGIVDQAADVQEPGGFEDTVHLRAHGAKKLAAWLGAYYRQYCSGETAARGE